VRKTKSNKCEERASLSEETVRLFAEAEEIAAELRQTDKNSPEYGSKAVEAKKAKGRWMHASTIHKRT